MPRSKRDPARLPMGELEARVMRVLWEHGEPMTPGEVNDALVHERELAYTTVMTILVRLHEKGTVERERRGRAWAYRPVKSWDEHTAERMTALLREGGDRSAALTRFVDGMTSKERAGLRRLLGRERRQR